MTSTSPRTQQDPVSLYERAVVSARKVVASVQPGQWAAPTPCSEWNVRQVVNHMVGGAERIIALLQGQTFERREDYLGSAEPLATYDRATGEAIGVAKRPGALDQSVMLRTETPAGLFMSNQFLDVLVHGWDIAASTGQDRTMDPELAEECWAYTQLVLDRFRGGSAFAEPQEVMPGASTQDKLLAALGRDPSYSGRAD